MYAVDIAGTDAAGCAFEYRKELRPRMSLKLIAEARATDRRAVTKNVSSNYFLDITARPLGTTPTFTSACSSFGADLTTGVTLGGLLGSAIVFNPAQTMLAGSWINQWNYTPWPFQAAGYLQLWPNKPPRQGGVYRLPAPMNALAARKGFTITKSLTGKRQVVGKPSITVSIVGNISFTFKRVS